MNEFKEKYGKGLGLVLGKYDKRDFHFGDFIPPRFINIPDEYRTESAVDFTYDQGQTSMCCACSYSFHRYLQEKEQSGLNEQLSPAYTYSLRNPDEMYEGMDIRSCFKHGNVSGSVLFRDLPVFDTLQGTIDARVKADTEKKNGFTLEDRAKPFTPSSYYCCYSRKEVQTAILLYKSVVIGIPVYNSLYEPINGVVDFVKGEVMEGGHAVTPYGWYTDKSTGKFYRVIKNSWGSEYGDKGTFYLSEDYPWLENAWVAIDKNVAV